LSAYARQQVGYGQGEAWLRARHQHRFSRSNVRWHGRIYSPLPFVKSLTDRRLHSGVWGTAAFPTVYHTGAHPLRALPHTVTWQLGALLLFLLGTVLLALPVSPIAALCTIGGGAVGIATTLVKCIRYARQSDIERLPRVNGYGRITSTIVYRATIAALHVVQPFARIYGYVQGRLRSPVIQPEALAPPDSGRSALAAPSAEAPSSSPPVPLMPLVLGRPAVWRYWSEAWVNADALLTRVVQRLRVMRFGHGIQIDDGWRADRDISVAVGIWAWAHVQALVEEHGAGRCLFRARVQLKPRAASATLLALGAAAAVLSVLYNWQLFGAALATAIVVLVAWAARTTSRDLKQLAAAIADVAREEAMLQLSDASPRSPAPVSAGWNRADAAHGG
jgi:hypothetical protein